MHYLFSQNIAPFTLRERGLVFLDGKPKVESAQQPEIKAEQVEKTEGETPEQAKDRADTALAKMKENIAKIYKALEKTGFDSKKSETEEIDSIEKLNSQLKEALRDNQLTKKEIEDLDTWANDRFFEVMVKISDTIEKLDKMPSEPLAPEILVDISKDAKPEIIESFVSSLNPKAILWLNANIEIIDREGWKKEYDLSKITTVSDAKDLAKKVNDQISGLGETLRKLLKNPEQNTPEIEPEKKEEVKPSIPETLWPKEKYLGRELGYIENLSDPLMNQKNFALLRIQALANALNAEALKNTMQLQSENKQSLESDLIKVIETLKATTDSGAIDKMNNEASDILTLASSKALSGLLAEVQKKFEEIPDRLHTVSETVTQVMEAGMTKAMQEVDELKQRSETEKEILRAFRHFDWGEEKYLGTHLQDIESHEDPLIDEKNIALNDIRNEMKWRSELSDAFIPDIKRIKGGALEKELIGNIDELRSTKDAKNIPQLKEKIFLALQKSFQLHEKETYERVGKEVGQVMAKQLEQEMSWAPQFVDALNDVNQKIIPEMGKQLDEIMPQVQSALEKFGVETKKTLGVSTPETTKAEVRKPIAIETKSETNDFENTDKNGNTYAYNLRSPFAKTLFDMVKDNAFLRDLVLKMFADKSLKIDTKKKLKEVSQEKTVEKTPEEMRNERRLEAQSLLRAELLPVVEGVVDNKKIFGIHIAAAYTEFPQSHITDLGFSKENFERADGNHITFKVFKNHEALSLDLEVDKDGKLLASLAPNEKKEELVTLLKKEKYQAR